MKSVAKPFVFIIWFKAYFVKVHFGNTIMRLDKTISRYNTFLYLENQGISNQRVLLCESYSSSISVWPWEKYFIQMLGKKNTKMQRDKKDWQWVAGFVGLKICNKFIKSEDLVSSNLLVKILLSQWQDRCCWKISTKNKNNLWALFACKWYSLRWWSCTSTKT